MIYDIDGVANGRWEEKGVERCGFDVKVVCIEQVGRDDGWPEWGGEKRRIR